MSLGRGSRARDSYPFPLLNELALAMPEGSKDGAERRYNLRATPSRKGRVDDGHQEAGEARFPDNGSRIAFRLGTEDGTKDRPHENKI